MKKSVVRVILATAVLCLGAIGTVRAQQGTLTPAEREQQWQTENDLQLVAIIERKVMMPMGDGVRLATAYRTSGPCGRKSRSRRIRAPYVRWCGRGEWATAPPIPIVTYWNFDAAVVIV
ncbi:MAG TPA: hypothetical protein VKO18_13010 [Terriglobia bacterium]|nr:hypothetical protein [Terriglobia bacterium]